MQHAFKANYIANVATTAKRDKKERSSFLYLLICPALSGYPPMLYKSGV
jgi:hypothetical protein